MYRFKRIIEKWFSEEDNNEPMPLKRRIVLIATAAAVVIAVLCLSVYYSVETYNDGKHADSGTIKIATRLPIEKGDFFRGGEPDTGIFISWYDTTVRLGEDEDTLELGGVIYPITLKDRALQYTSSNTDVAEIDENGKITVKNPGNAEITVSNAGTGQSVKARVQVVQPVTGFYLQKSTITLYTTDTGVRLASAVVPDNASNSAVQWYSKDPGIVEVDQTGRLKPVNTGMTEVVAKTTDGGFSGKCFVNVVNEVIKAQSVTIQNKDNISIKKGETWLAAVSVLPANAKNKTVKWSSDNEDVAVVSQNGTVRAMSEGKAVITAQSPDGPSDTVEITVTGASSSSGGAILDMNPTYTSEGGVSYTTYNITLDEMTAIQMSLNPPPKNMDGSGTSYATYEETKEYLDPNQFSAGAYKYQFLDLSHYSGISEEALNAYLENKGILRGQAAAFIEAAKRYNVSEIYLVAHACLETGNGTSQLSTGVEVNGETVYNMYGIAAYDDSALASGSQKAYKEGWTTPEAAIIGGAEWISEYYINSDSGRQNTLYKMRWNPDNPGEHLYATDIGWAVKQAVIIENMLTQFPEASLAYEVPVYAGSNAPVIDE